jgi:hypothetical protein
MFYEHTTHAGQFVGFTHSPKFAGCKIIVSVNFALLYRCAKNGRIQKGGLNGIL